MTVKRSRTYDTGKTEDVRGLAAVMRRVGKRITRGSRESLAEKIQAGERMMVTIPPEIDDEQRRQARRAKRSQAKRSRKANRPRKKAKR